MESICGTPKEVLEVPSAGPKKQVERVWVDLLLRHGAPSRKCDLHGAHQTGPSSRGMYWVDRHEVCLFQHSSAFQGLYPSVPPCHRGTWRLWASLIRTQCGHQLQMSSKLTQARAPTNTHIWHGTVRYSTIPLHPSKAKLSQASTHSTSSTLLPWTAPHGRLAHLPQHTSRLCSNFCYLWSKHDLSIPSALMSVDVVRPLWVRGLLPKPSGDHGPSICVPGTSLHQILPRATDWATSRWFLAE